MDTESYFSRVEEAAAWLRGRASMSPRVVVVLSAGLGSFVGDMEGTSSISSSEIPHFPRAMAEGHEGRLVFGRMKGVPMVAVSGRFHCYEGHSPQSVVFPYFVLTNLGARILITTNAAGGVNRKFRAGDLMIVRDHINMMGINPLVGIAVQRRHDQFTSMNRAYDPALRDIALREARRIRMKLREGVYLAVMGPSYETKAEIAAFRRMGADAIGMSTVPEVIASNFLGLRVLSFSCIANPAADLHEGEMSHAEVLESMQRLSPRAVRLLEGIVAEAGR
ncbi:MAG: purine-nucleoside phosphorylase [Proteobacteria bacterium]|nr:purine-nucleoside phosphorylase [Pseudomonadota bacterium]